MNDQQTVKERLARIEAHLEHIRENMIYKSNLALIKWAIGGVATLAMSALLVAAKAKGAF